MADVAFLLLIFFLVSTVFPKDKGLALVLPDSTAPVAPENVLHLIVQTTGMVVVRHGADSQGAAVPVRTIADTWRTEVAENPRLIAAVQTGPEVAYQRTVDVLDQLRRAGALRVSLQLLER